MDLEILLLRSGIPIYFPRSLVRGHQARSEWNLQAEKGGKGRGHYAPNADRPEVERYWKYRRQVSWKSLSRRTFLSIASREWYPDCAIGSIKQGQMEPFSPYGHRPRWLGTLYHSGIMSLRRGSLECKIVLRNWIKGHRATLLLSPDRVIGLGDAMRWEGILIFSLWLWQIVSFRDLRFVLVVCLLKGFTIWNKTSTSDETGPVLFASSFRRSASGSLMTHGANRIRFLSAPLTPLCTGNQRLLSPYQKRLWPLPWGSTHYDHIVNKAISLSIMLGAVVVAQALGFSTYKLIHIYKLSKGWG